MVKSKALQVKEYIYKEIEAGSIRTGQRLPSCREVAAILNINKITVNKAYSELELEHKVYSIPRGGFYLVELVDHTTVAKEPVDFRAVKPEERLVPYREFTHVMNNAIRIHKNSLFAYEATGGLQSLKHILTKEFETDGVYTNANQLVITHGAQQAISLILQYVFGQNKGKLLVEIPTYNLVLKLAAYMGIELIGIERKENGIDCKQLEVLFKAGDIDAFYVMPRLHNPTGYNLSEKDKQRIAQLANKYNVLIIEDDYLADLGAKKGSMPIHYYDIRKSTVYIRSYSKIFMPGIRIGAMVLPDHMLSEILELKYISDLNTSKIPQSALEIFIQSGMYEKHIKKVKAAYTKKLKIAAEIFKSVSSSNLKWHIPEHGIYIWVQLPSKVKATELEKKLEQQGILIKAANEFFPMLHTPDNQADKEAFIRLCISGVSEKNMKSLATVISIVESWN